MDFGDTGERTDVFAILLRQSLQGPDALALLSAFSNHELDAPSERFVPFGQPF